MAQTPKYQTRLRQRLSTATKLYGLDIVTYIDKDGIRIQALTKDPKIKFVKFGTYDLLELLSEMLDHVEHSFKALEKNCK